MLFYVNMKGISPVIATVLLLLMAVAAVGGAWVWYQRMQVSAQMGGEGGISNIKATTSLQSVYIDRAYTNSNGNLTLYLGNQGADTVSINAVQVKNSTGNFETCNNNITASATRDIGSTDFITIQCKDWPYAHTSGTSLQVRLYASGASVTKIVSVE